MPAYSAVINNPVAKKMTRIIERYNEITYITYIVLARHQQVMILDQCAGST